MSGEGCSNYVSIFKRRCVPGLHHGPYSSLEGSRNGHRLLDAENHGSSWILRSHPSDLQLHPFSWSRRCIGLFELRACFNKYFGFILLSFIVTSAIIPREYNSLQKIFLVEDFNLSDVDWDRSRARSRDGQMLLQLSFSFHLFQTVRELIRVHNCARFILGLIFVSSNFSH